MKLMFDLSEAPSVIAKHKKNGDVELCKKTIDIGFYSKVIKNIRIFDKETDSITVPNKEFTCIKTNKKVIDKDNIFETFAYWLYTQKKDKLCTNYNTLGRYIVECEIEL
jgi:hypothetical protein